MVRFERLFKIKIIKANHPVVTDCIKLARIKALTFDYQSLLQTHDLRELGTTRKSTFKHEDISSEATEFDN